MKHFFFLLCLLGSFVTCLQAARTDTVRVYSKAMDRDVPVVVVSPDGAVKELPAVYLLHGFSDNYKQGWISKVDGITRYADLYNCLLVMPDGGFSSWYFDSPIDSTFRYETFVVSELVAYIDRHFPTSPVPGKRGITGNSMGGHGALFLALRHPDVFGVAGSMSGGVNLCPFADSFDISKRLGNYREYPERWKAYSVVYLIEEITPPFPALIVDCGTEDFFYHENCAFHEKLMQLRVPHDFISRPGGHNWRYWSIALQHQILFFNRFFSLYPSARQLGKDSSF